MQIIGIREPGQETSWQTHVERKVTRTARNDTGKESTNTINPPTKLRLIRPIEWIGPANGRKVSPNSRGESFSPLRRSLPRSLISRGGKGKRGKKKKEKRNKERRKSGQIGGMISVVFCRYQWRLVKRCSGLGVYWSNDHNGITIGTWPAQILRVAPIRFLRV